jgi:DNA-binding NarL/FixJ family response regulator
MGDTTNLQTPASCNAQPRRFCEPDPMALRVLLVDDNRDFIEAAARLLEAEGLNIVGTARTIAEALALNASLKPEVALVDIKLGRESGIDLARRLGDAADAAPPYVLLISTHAEEDFRDLIDASPAVGFVAKSALSADAILAALVDLAS